MGVRRGTADGGRRMRRAAAGLALLALSACSMFGDAPSPEQAAALTGGDPRRGPERLREYGCDACHTIPGVRGADALVGPPLSGLASRMYIAGVLTNTPEHLVRWIRDPTEVDPRTAMPDVDVTEQDARDMAAYLYTLD